MTINRRSLLATFAAAPVLTLGGGLGGVAQAATSGAGAITHGFTLGDARVTVLLDGHLPVGTQLINGYDEARAQQVLAQGLHRMQDNALTIPVNGYLVERAGRRVLIDTGTAQLMGPGLGALHAGLVAAGLHPTASTPCC